MFKVEVVLNVRQSYSYVLKYGHTVRLRMFVVMGSGETSGMYEREQKGYKALGSSVQVCGVISDRNGRSET